MINKMYDSFKKYIKENYKFLIVLIILVVFCLYDTGYSIYKPGGTINTSDRITGDVYKSKGSFNMAYVGMIEGKLPYYLLAKVIPNWELVKNDKITYSEHETMEDSLTRDHLYYEEAISSATMVAYNKANVNYSISKENSYVIYLSDNNQSDLKVGDEILKYDNIKFTDIKTFTNYINTKEVGTKIAITYLRDKQEYITDAKIYLEKNRKFIGVSIVKIVSIKSDKAIDIKTKASESGPSGGLILSLSIYNALTKEDITHGLKIVGTGTIDADGNVGEIGSVTYKLASAVKDNADLFICPIKNYKEATEYAKKQKYDIIIKGAETFDDALNILNNMEEKWT